MEFLMNFDLISYNLTINITMHFYRCCWRKNRTTHRVFVRNVSIYYFTME